MLQEPRISLLYLAVQNLKRRPGRSVVSALGVVLATATLFAITLGFLGIQRSMAIGLERLGADLLVVPEGQGEVAQEALVMGSPTMFYMDGSVESAIASVPGVTAVSSQVYVETLESAACCTGRLLVVGYDSTTDFTVKPWLMNALNRPLQPNEAVGGRLILTEVGEPISLYGTEYTIVAKLYETGMGMDETVFLPREAVYAMARNSREKAEQELKIPPGGISAVLVKLDPAVPPQEAIRAIKEQVPGVEVIFRGEVARSVVGGYQSAVQGLLFAAGTALITALILVAIVFSAVVNERRRELGLLRAMGAAGRDVLNLILLEAVILTGAGALAGIVIGSGFFYLFQGAIKEALRVPYLWPSIPQFLGLIVATVALAAGAGAVAAGWPAARAARLEPYAAIRLGE